MSLRPQPAVSTRVTRRLTRTRTTQAGVRRSMSTTISPPAAGRGAPSPDEHPALAPPLDRVERVVGAPHQGLRVVDDVVGPERREADARGGGAIRPLDG